MAKEFGFRPSQRIRSRREYDAIYRARQRFRTELFYINYCINECGFDRLGLSVSRKLGGAVKRNRIKRKIRDIFRTNPSIEAPGVDLVVTPSHEFLNAGHEQVVQVWRNAVGRIKARLRK